MAGAFQPQEAGPPIAQVVKLSNTATADGARPRRFSVGPSGATTSFSNVRSRCADSGFV